MTQTETTNQFEAEELAIETRRAVGGPITLLGIAGSVRQGSYNRLLLKAASRLLPPSTRLDIFEINRIPLYNQDLEERAFPEEVMIFKRKIEASDALLISTPEYNHAYPGVLKNAIDWASRPYGHNSFVGKPIAVISASPGLFGGIAAQDQLKQVLLALNTRLVTQPAVIVTSTQQKIGEDGNILDPNTKQFLQQLLTNLVNIARLSAQYEQTFVAPALRPILTDRLRKKA
ncbi:MAG TPA: NAD(P)H-dependent oxidoreductase [archaeon]|nr:NAD(P)H-dependent oxidoreductase [archaeon]